MYPMVYSAYIAISPAMSSKRKAIIRNTLQNELRHIGKLAEIAVKAVQSVTRRESCTPTHRNKRSTLCFASFLNIQYARNANEKFFEKFGDAMRIYLYCDAIYSGVLFLCAI